MWISIEDRLPDEAGRYKVRTLIGSVALNEEEREVFFRVKGFKRFVVGDWERVTHWWEDA